MRSHKGQENPQFQVNWSNHFRICNTRFDPFVTCTYLPDPCFKEFTEHLAERRQTHIIK